ncbi:MAG: hypothetical protein EKK39_14245 [Sphingobacteriales bacterium]|nr:MAG: hypothetical protein EKK39_14245 [Sphingobacteriales bacterium]
MVTDAEIREALQQWAERFGPRPTILAKVVAVDELNYTCDLQDDDGTQFYGIRLRPVLDGNEAVTQFPSIGTWAIAVRIESDEDWMLLTAGQIDKIRVSIGAATFQITNQGFLLQNGAAEMWQAFSLLFQALEKIVVLQGTNIDYVKLEQSKQTFKTLLNGT